jgi:hypothetical protein
MYCKIRSNEADLRGSETEIGEPIIADCFYCAP